MIRLETGRRGETGAAIEVRSNEKFYFSAFEKNVCFLQLKKNVCFSAFEKKCLFFAIEKMLFLHGSGDDDVPPNSTIMVRGLAQHITENHIREDILATGLTAKDIRLIRKKETGNPLSLKFMSKFSLRACKVFFSGPGRCGRKRWVATLKTNKKAVLPFSAGGRTPRYLAFPLRFLSNPRPTAATPLFHERRSPSLSVVPDKKEPELLRFYFFRFKNKPKKSNKFFFASERILTPISFVLVL
jgi:hypothetical protein